MRRPVVIDPRAEQEIADAYAWYGRRNPEAAASFRAEVKQAIEKIRRASGSLPPYLDGTRMCLLKKFPYLVVFREYADHLFVIAVAHGRRRLGYWQNRV